MSESSKANIPSELRLSKSWDMAVERLMINATLGVVVGGLASIVLFKKPSSRIAFSSLSAGWGLGSAWTLNSIDFEKERNSAEASK